MQSKAAKFQIKIKTSTVVVQLCRHYFGENNNLTQDHLIECSSEQLQLLVIQWLARQKCIKEINRVKQIFYYWLLNKLYWYFKTRQISHCFQGMHSGFLLNFVHVWIIHFALNIACNHKFFLQGIIIQRQFKLTEICLILRTVMVWSIAKFQETCTCWWSTYYQKANAKTVDVLSFFLD